MREDIIKRAVTDSPCVHILCGKKCFLVSLDMQAAVRANGTQTIQVLSQGYPILGDPQYATPQSREFSQKHGLYTQLLCAKQLEFVHPVTSQKLCLQSNLYPDF